MVGQAICPSNVVVFLVCGHEERKMFLFRFLERESEKVRKRFS